MVVYQVKFEPIFFTFISDGYQVKFEPYSFIHV